MVRQRGIDRCQRHRTGNRSVRQQHLQVLRCLQDGGRTAGATAIGQEGGRRKVTNMSRKLVEAQEQERARIGRELHDDVTQRLVMLALELEKLEDNPSEVRSRVQELQKQMTELS